MDQKFFQLVFTPFFSSAMQGTDSHIPWDRNIEIMVKRLQQMPATLRAELLLGLELEIKATTKKLNSIPKDLQIDFQLKIEAIKKVLEYF